MRRVVLAVAVVLAACGHPSAVDRAGGVLDDDGRFETGADGARAFARVADLLLADGRQCADAHGTDDDACARRLAAAGYAQVVAAALVDCTTAAMEDARAGLEHYLDGDGDLPNLPTCA